MSTTKIENSATQLASAAVTKKQWGDIIFNVKVYGAVGDFNGTTGTDDTTAFRKAIDAARAVKGIVKIPPGNYLITGEWLVDYEFRLEGSGMGNTFISCSGTFTLIKFSAERLDIRDMTLRQVSGNVRCIEAIHSSGGVYAGVYLKGTNCAIDYFSNDAIYAEDVIDSQFIKCTGVGPYKDTTPGTTTTRTSSWLRINYNSAFNTTISLQYCYVSAYKHALHGINCVVVNIIQSVFENNWIALYGTRNPSGPSGAPALFWTIDGNWFEANLHSNNGGGLFDDLTTPANYVNAVYIRANNYSNNAARDGFKGQGIRAEVLTDLNGNLRLRRYTTAGRPNPGTGLIVDTTLNKLIWFDEVANNWKDAMGTVV